MSQSSTYIVITHTVRVHRTVIYKHVHKSPIDITIVIVSVILKEPAQA